MEGAITRMLSASATVARRAPAMKLQHTRSAPCRGVAAYPQRLADRPRMQSDPVAGKLWHTCVPWGTSGASTTTAASLRLRHTEPLPTWARCCAQRKPALRSRFASSPIVLSTFAKTHQGRANSRRGDGRQQARHPGDAARAPGPRRPECWRRLPATPIEDGRENLAQGRTVSAACGSAVGMAAADEAVPLARGHQAQRWPPPRLPQVRRPASKTDY